MALVFFLLILWFHVQNFKHYINSPSSLQQPFLLLVAKEGCGDAKKMVLICSFVLFNFISFSLSKSKLLW